MSFGGSQVTKERESGALISISDDLKASSTDAMKECAAVDQRHPPGSWRPPRQRPPEQRPRQRQHHDRQLDAIWKVGRVKGLDSEAVEHTSLRVFNRKPDALTHDEASKLVKELSHTGTSAGSGAEQYGPI